MSRFNNIAETIFEKTNTDKIYTYPGTPGQHLYKYVKKKPELEIQQVVREQHLLHLAQTRYYNKLEEGEKEIPVVVVSGAMGEGMASQPLIAGTISAPILMIVTESIFEHKGNDNNTVYQSGRGKTPEKIEDREILREHDNVERRVLFRDSDNLNEIKEMIEDIQEEKGVGVLHLPWYAYEEKNQEYNKLVDEQPETITAEEVKKEWDNSEKPIIHVGRGIKEPEKRELIQKIARKSGATITSTWQMDGYFKENFAGSLGVCGTPSANEAFHRSDLVLALGTSLNNLQTSLNPDKMKEFKDKVIQLSGSSRNNSYITKKQSEEDIKTVLEALENLEGSQWFEFDNYGLDYFEEEIPDNMKAVSEIFREEFSDRVITLGVGNAMIWLSAALGPEIKKETSRTGSMGEAISGLNRENKPVIVLGDGEFEMDISIIPEALEQNSNATIIITWNKRLGLVTERQEKKTGEILTPKSEYINYEEIGKGFIGVKSHLVESPKEIKNTLRECLDSNRVDIVTIPIEEKISSEIFDLSRLPKLSDN